MAVRQQSTTNLTKLEESKNNNGQILYNPGLQSSEETYPERLQAVISAKGDSNMY
jgi:hypothetical protein